MRLVLLSAIGLWLGGALVLSELRWFARQPLTARLRPYSPGGLRTRASHGSALSAETFRDVVKPICDSLGERLARLFGVNEDLAIRLERVHSPLDASAFRLRQLGFTLATFAVAVLVIAAVGPPAPAALLLLLGGPLLTFLLLEQKLSSASEAWKRRLFLELPVVAEQLAMLLSAGFSLGAALNRLAERGRGHAAADLGRVCGRIRQGLSETDAIREWAEVAGVPALDRLVPVLALNREASDLGRLISEEARAIRKDVQRRLVETAERRAQQVWIPVTVAALVPGVIFIAVPFVEALRLFSTN